MATKKATQKASAPELIWKISQLERETADGFVSTVHYTVDLKDDVYSAGAYGLIGLEKPETLIPYSELTEEMVVSWVLAQLGEEKVLEVKQALESSLNEQRQPTKAAGVPWA